MHQIQSLEIKNFRSIKDWTFSLSVYTPLVGYNNAGKSNLLRAISWLLKKSSLVEMDFFCKGSPVVVSGTIVGITPDILALVEEKHRSRILPYIKDEELHIRRTQLSPGASVKDIILEVKLADGAEAWAKNPTGIDGAISQLFPDPIFIEAMQDAAEDVAKFGRSTTIGQLFTEIVAPIREKHSAKIREALANVQAALSPDGAQRDETLVKIDELMAEQVGKYFPGISVKADIPIPQFDDFLKGGTVKVFEPGHETDDWVPINAMGHGAQRAVQMALINCLSRIKAEGESGSPKTTLLLVDEPELYLHPTAIERTRAALNSLSRSEYQVVFSTHSACMVAREDAANVLLVRKENTKGTYCLPTLTEAVNTRIAEADHQAELLFSLSHSSKILFSDRVIIAEGKTERRLLPGILHVVTGKTIEEMKAALVEVDGTNNVLAAMGILSAMGIPNYAIVDLDFAFKIAAKNELLVGQADAVSGCRSLFLDMQNAGAVVLGDDGYPTKSNGHSAAEGFELLANCDDAKAWIAEIHDALKEKNIWVWKLGAIEKHLGLEGKSSSHWAKFTKTLVDTKSVDFVTDPASFKELGEWLQ
jgi:Predicted ATP-dependent endonuclease of the OLD family